MESTGFAQQAAEQVERLRTRAALAMVVASLTVGFLVGRASVWLVPFDGRSSAGVVRQTAAVGPETRPAPPPARPSDSKASEPSRPPTGQAELKAPGLAPTGDQVGPSTPSPSADEAAKPSEDAPRNPTKGPPPVDTARSPETAERAAIPESKKTRQGVTLINPGSADAGRDAQERGASRRESAAAAAPGNPTPAGSEECARRFSSFQPSDGTYQPYGGGPRARCPLLR
jgi:BA14K-like protein